MHILTMHDYKLIWAYTEYIYFKVWFIYRGDNFNRWFFSSLMSESHL